MKYISIEEIEKTSFLDLVSGIGGTLGLFIGMSFLSFFELFDVLIETAIILVNSERKQIDKPQPPRPRSTVCPSPAQTKTEIPA